MAYSKIQIPGNGTNGPFTVAFALGYLSQSEVTCRVNQEVDGLGAPVYRTITWLDAELVNISGAAPTALDTITFERTLDKTTLKHDFSDGAPIIERNLDESHKQAIMLVHEALDGRFGALQGDLDVGNHYVKNVLDPVEADDAATKAYVDLQVFSSGNVPAPVGGDTGKVLTATGAGTWAWGTPVVVPAATESVAGIGEIATDAEITTGTDNTNKFLNVLKAVTAFARKSVSNTFTTTQIITMATGSTALALHSNDPGAAGPTLQMGHTKAAGAVNDVPGIVLVQARDSAGTLDTVADIRTTLDGVTPGAVNAHWLIRTMRAGARAARMIVGNGVLVGFGSWTAPNDKGTGTINVSAGYYFNGQPIGGPSAKFSHETSNGTDGGATVATTWTTMPLTHTKHNNIPGCSLAANQVTLAAGTYRIRGWHTYYNVGLRWRLRNITDGTDIDISGTFKTPTGIDCIAPMDDIQFTIAGTKVLAWQYYASAAVANGFGFPLGNPPSYNEKWGELYIEKIA